MDGIKCIWCGMTYEPKTTDILIKRENEDLVVIKKLPCLKCPNCGDETVSPETITKITEKLLQVQEGEGEPLKKELIATLEFSFS